MEANISELPFVDGATRVYGIIGDPIAQVKSPEVMTARFRKAGRNAVMVPLHVRPERFDETLRGLMALANLDGLIATVPYKARVLPYIDTVLPTGQQVGAINAMKRGADGRWTGDMFDGRGLIRGLREHGLPVVDKRVMLLGTGGAGSAVAVAMAEAGAAAVTLYDRDEGKARALAGRVTAAYPGCKVEVGPVSLEGHDTLVNATPIGMAPGDGLPVELGPLDPRLLVIDVIMKPEVTPLLHHAQACGCHTVGGRAMLEGQVEEVVKFFGIEG
jgi:shikimate dehydrogenase